MIGFRVDASEQIGSGHVMRCLSLADMLRKRGADCTFFCRPHSGNMLDVINKRGFRVVMLPPLGCSTLIKDEVPAHASWLGTSWSVDAVDTHNALNNKILDWLIVDHYALDRRWEKALRIGCNKLMVIDDLADRPHDCDILLDQNLGCSVLDYRGLLPEKALLLAGTQFALLREEFALLRSGSLSRRSKMDFNHLLIAMGGVDQKNFTGKILGAITAFPLPKGMRISAVLGPKAPWLTHVKIQASKMPQSIQVLIGVSDMAKLMSDSDVAIGAAGGTAWERCCMGLPSIILVTAENQRKGAVALQNAGAAIMVDSVIEIQPRLNLLLRPDTKSNILSQLSLTSSQIVDGQGAYRVYERLLNYA
jgi:UDP-2,4-diacetamido-2,4,6-trideoxy-beta-L-altropyranose hydrolase